MFVVLEVKDEINIILQTPHELLVDNANIQWSGIIFINWGKLVQKNLFNYGVFVTLRKRKIQ